MDVHPPIHAENHRLLTCFDPKHGPTKRPPRRRDVGFLPQTTVSPQSRQSDCYDNLGVTRITYVYIYIHHPYGYIAWLYGNDIIHVGIDPYRLT